MSATQTLRGKTASNAPAAAPVTANQWPAVPQSLPDQVRRAYDAIHALGTGSAPGPVDAVSADVFFDELCDDFFAPHIFNANSAPVRDY